MDGAIILASDCSRVARANVHLVPDPNIPTSETGTRHRTAERVGRQIDVPGDHASRRTCRVVAIHRRGEKHTLEPIPRVLARADQALQILGRYKARLDAVSGVALGARGRGPRHRPRRRHRAAARRDGAAHRRGDRGLRRSSSAPTAGSCCSSSRSSSAASRTTAASSPRTTSSRRGRLRARRRDARSSPRSTTRTLLDLDAGGRRAPPRRRRSASTPRAAARLPAAAQDPAPARARVRPRRRRGSRNLQKIMRAELADLTEVEGVGDVARPRDQGGPRPPRRDVSILERYV